MELFGLFLFAMALNMDSLGVGISYGIRKIHLPWTSILIISLMSMTAITISMMAGRLLGRFLAPEVGYRLGGIILIMIGIYIIYQYFREKINGFPSQADIKKTIEQEINEPVQVLRVSFLGFVIQILKKPHIADMNMSGTISGREALLLGFALAIDSLAAGVAVSLLGYSILATAICVGVGHLLLTFLGLSIGRSLSKSCFGRHITALSGIILVLMGVQKMY